MNGILIIVFEYTKEVFGNWGDLVRLNHLKCQEVPGIFNILSDTIILMYEQKLMVCIQWHIYMGWSIYGLMWEYVQIYEMKMLSDLVPIKFKSWCRYDYYKIFSTL